MAKRSVHPVDQKVENASAWLSEIEAKSNLSRSQMLIWIGQVVERKAPLYNTVFAWRITGPLDVKRFDRAFNQLVLDCDALRTQIEERHSVPLQRYTSSVPAPLEIVDLSDDPGQLDVWVSTRAKRQLRIDRCTYDSALLLLGSRDAVWYLNQHHIVTDGTSWGLLFERLITLYERPQEAGPPPPSYAAYVQQERASRTNPRTERARNFWNEKYTGSISPGLLYGHFPRKDASRSVRVSTVLSEQRSAAIRALAAQPGIRLLSEEVTLFVLFACAQLAWLRRVSGRERLTIGVPVHNRSAPSAEKVPGLLMEVFPLEVEIEGVRTLRSLLTKVARATVELFGNAVPGASTPETSRAFDVLLNYFSVRMPRAESLEVQSRWVHAGAGDRNHKLRLQVHDFDNTGDYHLDFDFSSLAFDEDTRQLAVQHYLTVLDAMLTDLDVELDAIDLLTDAERQKYIHEFNTTQSDYPAERPVTELISEQASLIPNAIAIREDDRFWTYAELERRANRLAHQLLKHGAGPGRAVVLCAERSMNSVAAVLAVIKTGAVLVPLDIKHPPARIAAIVADLAGSELGSPAVVISDAGAEGFLPKGIPIVFAEHADDVKSEPLQIKTSPDSLAYIIYTSGSTGTPKGVMISQRALLNYLWWARNEYCADGPNTFALHSSLAVDLTITSIFVPLVAGGTVTVYADRGEKDLPILRVFAEDTVDVVKLTPAHLALVRELGGKTSRICTLILGGEDLKRDLVQSVATHLPSDLRVYNEYGPTEATVGCMFHRFNPQKDTSSSVPVGRPIANTRIYVLDRVGRPVGVGIIGELCIAGDGLALGYLNRECLTAQAFVPDTVFGEGRMYRSGDLARFTPSGRLEYLGRDDEQVKIRGSRVELGEVEAALATHPVLRNVVAIVARPDENVVERCAKCGVPSNYPGILFNNDKVCSMCLAFDLFEDQARAYFKTMEDFHSVAEQMKGATESGPHCLALVSGGKDSSYMLYQLVALGVRPLVFSLDNGFVSEEALKNVARAADDLGLEHVIGSTPHMNEIFADSLERYSNVCHGCFKTIYTLSLNLAHERGLKHIVTGLSRGQIFETRLDDLYRHRIFDVGTIERAILEARKIYHRVDDAVARTLDVKIFSDDTVLNEVQFIDFYRYCDVDLDEIYEFLEYRAPWVRPSDTGRSTNCLINDVGIYVHGKERGFHNYALPYSWDVRIGHKTREAALYELDDELNIERIQTILDEVGYYPKPSRSETHLVAYYTANETVPTTELRTYLAERLPNEMVPTIFVHLQELPLNNTGKVDRNALPPPTELQEQRHTIYEAPQTEVERRLADLWCEVLQQTEIGRHDNFFDRGGVSLGAIQILGRVQETFGIELPVQTFFNAPTIAAVAQSVEELLISDIESLSDNEVRRLLQEETN